MSWSNESCIKTERIFFSCQDRQQEQLLYTSPIGKNGYLLFLLFWRTNCLSASPRYCAPKHYYSTLAKKKTFLLLFSSEKKKYGTKIWHVTTVMRDETVYWEVIRNMSYFLSELFRALKLNGRVCDSIIIYACRPSLATLGADTDGLLDHNSFKSAVLTYSSWNTYKTAVLA